MARYCYKCSPPSKMKLDTHRDIPCPSGQAYVCKLCGYWEYRREEDRERK